MQSEVLRYSLVALAGVFISAISQVLLKKSAAKEHDSALAEYLNWRVIVAYTLFVLATLASTFAYKVIPLSMGPLLDATGYIYVTIFGLALFHEKLNPLKVCALVCILLGICVYSLGI